MSITRMGGVTYIDGGKAAAIVISRQGDGSIAAPTAKKNFSAPIPQNSLSSVPWACWGEDNLLPNKVYAKYIGRTGVLSSGTDMISRIAIGRGPKPVQVTSTDDEGNEQVKMINDEEINQWLIDNNINTFSYETILDALQTGHSFTQLLSNRAQDYINKIKRADASLCRFARREKNGPIKNIFLSYEWERVTTKDSEYVTEVPLLDINNPLQDLLNEDGSMKLLPKEFAIASHYRLFNNQYYATTLWWPVKAWCDIAMSVPELKAHMFNNQMVIKYVITIDEQYWTTRWRRWNNFTDQEREDHREIVLKEIDKWLSGNKNAYKSLITPTRVNPQTGEGFPLITVTPLEDPTREGKLLPDSAAANSEILFAIALNPALIGVDMPGGMYSGGKGGSNIREAFLVQILIREVEREFVIKPLNVVARVNGWTKRYPGLQWRFPNHYLTTLDSGKNAKPIM